MARTAVKPQLQLVPAPEAPRPAFSALETVYRDHARFVAVLALHVLGRDLEVDDVVQDVFLSAASGLARLREPAALRAWLGTITVRLARRRLRARRLLALFGLDPQPDYGELVATDASPEQRLLVSQVYLILDSVPAKDRVAWTLRYVEGARLEEVARLCECSLATAKRRIVAAQQRLETELADE